MFEFKNPFLLLFHFFSSFSESLLFEFIESFLFKSSKFNILLLLFESKFDSFSNYFFSF